VESASSYAYCNILEIEIGQRWEVYFKRYRFEKVSKHSLHSKVVTMFEASAMPCEFGGRVLFSSEWSSLLDSKSNYAADDQSSSCTPSTWPAGVKELDHGPDDSS
jgi:hypothetical protein